MVITYGAHHKLYTYRLKVTRNYVLYKSRTRGIFTRKILKSVKNPNYDSVFLFTFYFRDLSISICVSIHKKDAYNKSPYFSPSAVENYLSDVYGSMKLPRPPITLSKMKD